MDTATVEKKLAALRTGEDEVRARLSELDTKLGTWVEAIAEAHDAVRAILDGAALAGGELSEPAAARPEPEQPAAASPRVDGGGPRDASEGRAEAGESAAPRTSDRTPAPKPGKKRAAAPPAAARSNAPAEAIPVPPPPPDTVKRNAAVAPVPEAGSAAVDEDERLLADLEPEVANQIRVKRRLSGNRRSVRELLAEVEREIRAAKPGASPASRGGKRWWRKGND